MPRTPCGASSPPSPSRRRLPPVLALPLVDVDVDVDVDVNADVDVDVNVVVVAVVSLGALAAPRGA